MNHSAWVDEYLDRLRADNVLVAEQAIAALGPHALLAIEPEDWGRAAAQAAAAGLRWAGLWAEHSSVDDGLLVNACLARNGDYLVLRTQVDAATPILPSHAPSFPAADRLERHAQDLFGLAFSDHPDARRWTRHQAWPEGCYPLRHGAAPPDNPFEVAPGDSGYPFLQTQGSGVHEIPVGPVHAGIIEPGHFRFQAVGEEILNLEERLAYVHKGIEKIGQGRDPDALARLAGRVSGDSTVAHAWAACMAMEQAAEADVPPRALALRALLAERERVANHLGDIGAICNDVGFAFAQYQFSRLRELWQRDSATVFGHRLLMDRVVPGGVAVDPGTDAVQRLTAGIQRLRAELRELLPILEDYPSLEDRLSGTGVLTADSAARLGCLGYVARASGQSLDLRADRAYPPYHRLSMKVAMAEGGDVAARLKVRADELGIALELIEALLDELPAGPVRIPFPEPPADSEGLGAVEGWRGETLAYVRFDDRQRIARYFPRDPSWFLWPALEQLIAGNIVPDFPVCNKSVNGSYSGHDL